MDLRQLRTFKAAATTLSFTRTASALNYVQSSVTAQIQSLEEELGVQLFDRLGRSVALTDAGRRLLGYAERMLDLEEEARTVVSASEEPSGILTISAPETLCTYRLPEVLRHYRERHPRVKLHLVPSTFGDLRRYMLEVGADVAFMLDDPSEPVGVMVETLLTEPLMLLAAPGDPLTQFLEVGPEDIRGQQVLLTEGGCGYRAVFERALASAGIYPANIMEFNTVEAIKQCVMAGMGLTVLPTIAVHSEVEQGRLVPLAWTQPNFHVLTQMAVHRDKWLSPAVRAFLDIARDTLHEPVAAASTPIIVGAAPG
jgi:DNA-binding transcriptional LysR family regulator